jgi:hypothetical protein
MKDTEEIQTRTLEAGIEIIKEALKGAQTSIYRLISLAKMVSDPSGEGDDSMEAEDLICRALLELDPAPRTEEVIELAQAFRLKTGANRVAMEWLESNGVATREEVLEWARTLEHNSAGGRFLGNEALEVLKEAAEGIGIEVGDDLGHFIKAETCPCLNCQLRRLDESERTPLEAELKALSENGGLELNATPENLREKLAEAGVSDRLAEIIEKATKSTSPLEGLLEGIMGSIAMIQVGKDAAMMN